MYRVALLISIITCTSGETVYVENGLNCHNFTCNKEVWWSNLEDNTEVIFWNSSSILPESIEVKDKVNISLRGLEENGTALHCKKGVGVTFINVTNLSISSLTFSECAVIHNSTSLNTNTYQSTLEILVGIYIYNCTNVDIKNSEVKDGNGTGIAFLDTTGNIKVVNSTFDNNCGNRSIPGGGGVYVEFTYCPPGIVNANCGEFHQKTQNSSYLFQNCIFTRNYATTVDAHSTSFIQAKGINFHGLGRGGGLCIIFKGNASFNNILIDDCKFKQNEAIWGAGLHVAFQDLPQRNTITVRRSHFLNNNCYVNGGGGLVVGLLLHNPIAKENRVTIDGCFFIGNNATYGGGTKVYASKSEFGKLENEIKFINCLWENNTAHYGSAIDISPHAWHNLAGGLLPTVTFENSTFIANIIEDRIKTSLRYVHYDFGKGTVICTRFSLLFKGNTTFHNNTASALYLSSSRVEFESNSKVEFANNTGQEGGAVALHGLSVILLNDNCMLTFLNNTVTSFGGAIIYKSSSKHDYSYSRSCFIQYAGSTESVSERSISVVFHNNKAEGDDNAFGHSIFATTLLPCQKACLNMNKTENNSIVERIGFSCIGTFNFSDNRKNEISTAGVRFDLTINESNLLVSPGQKKVVPFKLIDDLDHETFGLFHTSIHNKTCHSNNQSDCIKLDLTYSYTSDKTARLLGEPGDEATLKFETIGFREIGFSLRFEIQDCQPGYVQNETVKKCVCSTAIEGKWYFGIQRCHQYQKVAYIHRGYWIGYVGKDLQGTENNLQSGYCPSGFCFNSYGHSQSDYPQAEYPLTKQPSKIELDDRVCGPYRTDRLCGRCRQNYSIFFHSINHQCHQDNKHCHVGLLLYVLSELVPVTALFLLAIFFRIQFTSGAVNGFIFFTQLVDTMFIDANGFISTNRVIMNLSKGYKFIYRMFNLEFFTLDELSFCIWSGATTMDVLAMKYVTIVFSLLLVAVTIIIMKLCNIDRFRLSTERSIIHGFSAFFVICYAQCTRVSLSILTPSQIYSIGNIKADLAVHYQGDLTFMRGKHLMYAIPAVFFLVVFVLVPPILLLVYPLCYKVFALLRIEETRVIKLTCRFIPLEKMKPLFDSFQSCFKDNYRFMAGFYFLYRFSTQATFVLTNSFTVFYVILETQLIIMLTIQAAVHAYRKDWHNILDILLFANLAIINIITAYNYKRAGQQNSKHYQHVINKATAVQLILIYLPLMYMTFYIIVWVVNYACGNKAKEKSHYQDFTDTLAMVDYRELDTSIERDELHASQSDST